MLTAEGNFETEHPTRYLVQLCRHARKMNHTILNHLGRRGHIGGARDRPEVLDVEWSDTAGTLRLNWGQCTMRAEPGTLTLRVEAADEDSLRRIQDLVAADLERFGRRDQLTVHWQPPARPVRSNDGDQ